MQHSGSRHQLNKWVYFLISVMAALATLSPDASAEPRASEFYLQNGMRVVVIPDTRAPVVTHMIWYRVGAADEPPGVSGIAHFLEHLMFKSTEKIPIGEFSKIVARLGGQDNAFTSQDATAYFQRIAKKHLGEVMAMEADRMVNLRLTEKEVVTERDVILEERRSRIENNPRSILDEQMDAALYLSHPYGIPIIGWEHEMKTLDREDALRFYERYYAPKNAVLVVSGDVTPESVRELAQETYGKVPVNDAVAPRDPRPAEPLHRSPRRLELKDPRAGKATIYRYYLAPNYANDKDGEAEALEVMMKIVGSGATSRLYQHLVVDKKIASSASGYFYGSGLDSGKIAVSAVANAPEGLDEVEREIDKVLAGVIANGVSDAELKRAKSSLTAEYIYESDSQSTLARRYGWGIAIGQSLEDIEKWPEAISKVTADEVKAAAAKYLDLRRSVTGLLVPAPTASANPSAGAVPAKPSGASKS